MKISLETYNPDWPQKFQKEKETLQDILNGLDPEIEHIGSTSVPDLSAKPIIDILVGHQTEEALNASVDLMLKEGYLYYQLWEDEIPQRRFFVKTKKSASDLGVPQTLTRDIPYVEFDRSMRTHHIHMVTTKTLWWKRHLLFRDYLRENEADRNAYQKLKTNLSKKEWEFGHQYGLAKSEFIQGIEKKLLKK